MPFAPRRYFSLMARLGLAFKCSAPIKALSDSRAALDALGVLSLGELMLWTAWPTGTNSGKRNRSLTP